MNSVSLQVEDIITILSIGTVRNHAIYDLICCGRPDYNTWRYDFS